ncbi:7886_t:CDS:2 [Acaulospora morrowiae]|uniref:Nucleolar protein 16 n=1 Tax=Acaulospora morrowiae TaxID=94023 RepID=A0A9N8ZLP2_9GLOM|nr:7886_t:CDS:2 [Acaulospora morrowiae]
MARPRKRNKIRNPSLKISRKNANKHFKKFRVKGNALIADNWDNKATLRQNYQRLGLMTSLNGVSGGVEKLYPEEPPLVLDKEELKKTLGPDEGIIERDEQGNVINVIIGKGHEEEDTEIKPAPAKTDVVKALEEQASKVYKHEKYQSEGEKRFCEELISKYGDDYQSMFRDIKLNVYQHTEAQLKKKCEKYLKERNVS